MTLQIAMRFKSILVVAALMLGGCSIYKLDIQQGNIVEQEQLDKLKVGMDKGQVRFLLGTPLVTDPFHENRWDYVYSRRHEGGERELQRVTVFFENEAVAKIDTSAYTPSARPSVQP
jgi:outer membrane protein assembly factor BamE